MNQSSSSLFYYCIKFFFLLVLRPRALLSSAFVPRGTKGAHNAYTLFHNLLTRNLFNQSYVIQFFFKTFLVKAWGRGMGLFCEGICTDNRWRKKKNRSVGKFNKPLRRFLPLRNTSPQWTRNWIWRQPVGHTRFWARMFKFKIEIVCLRLYVFDKSLSRIFFLII